MNPWKLLDSEEIATPSGAAGMSVMALMQRGKEFVIRVDGRELMSNTSHASEDALAELACQRLEECPAARVLIGGLGMGFTLAAALRGLGEGGHVVVAELVPAVVRWNRGPLGSFAGKPLDDARTEVFVGDVAELIRTPPSPWSAILLDVDNGPTGLTRFTNNWLYTSAGLDASFAALEPGGILGIWSAFPDEGFTRRMRRAGFDTEVVDVRSRGAKGGRRHFVWLGAAKGEPRPRRRG